MQLICAWKELLFILPGWIGEQLTCSDREAVTEIRLRRENPPVIIYGRDQKKMKGRVRQEDLNFCIHIASKYSPWSASSMAQGYLTAPGGHRIGISGQTVCKNGAVTGFQTVQSVCIRVAKDFPGIAKKVASSNSSALIIGPPGWGKTTFLRDYIRQLSNQGIPVSVVDERGELFPHDAFSKGECTDVITGCTKAAGIDMALRTMGPAVIAVDEITAEADCEALLRAGWCGVKLLATAHAGSRRDLLTRNIYRPLMDTGIFDTLIILQADKTCRAERMLP